MLTRIKIAFGVFIVLVGTGLFLSVFRPSAIQVTNDPEDRVIILAEADLGVERTKRGAVHIAVNVDDVNYYSKRHQEKLISVQVTAGRGQTIELFVTQVENTAPMDCWFKRLDVQQYRTVGAKRIISPLRIECWYRSLP